MRATQIAGSNENVIFHFFQLAKWQVVIDPFTKKLTLAVSPVSSSFPH
jgi:hypothetical protein